MSSFECGDEARGRRRIKCTTDRNLEGAVWSEWLCRTSTSERRLLASARDSYSTASRESEANTGCQIMWRAVRDTVDPRRHAKCVIGACIVTLSLGVLPGTALADHIGNAYIDGRKDQLVVAMFYRGTNPNHRFSLKWGRCRKPPNGGVSEIVADVLDRQWQDAARRSFKKTTRFSLAGLGCRPANLTLRAAPRSHFELRIPAANAPKR